jgi:hypothetical protein
MGLSWSDPKSQLFDRVQKDFAFTLVNRLRVIAEVEKYRWKEDESVWSQKRERSPLQYEVYFDDEFVCFFGLEDTQDQAYIRVMENLLKLYKEKKIYWNTFLYEFNKPEKKVVKEKEATSPEEKIIKEAFKRADKKKGKRAKSAR